MHAVFLANVSFLPLLRLAQNGFYTSLITRRVSSMREAWIGLFLPCGMHNNTYVVRDNTPHLVWHLEVHPASRLTTRSLSRLNSPNSGDMPQSTFRRASCARRISAQLLRVRMHSALSDHHMFDTWPHQLP